MEKTIYELFDELVDEAMKRKGEGAKAAKSDGAEATAAAGAAVKPKEEKPKTELITVAYTYNDEGSDAHVILPADANEDPNVAASVTYALAYAIADTATKGAKLGECTIREELANEIINAMTRKLLGDAIMQGLEEVLRGA